MDAIRRSHRRSSAAIAALTWALVVGGIACTPEGLGSRTAISEPDPERVDTIDFQEVAAALVNGGWVLDLPRVPELRAIEVTADGEVVTCSMSPDLVAAIRCPPRAS